MNTLAAATDPNQTVLTGALLLALPIALLGGLVSFFSPCVLPLVPGYMSYVTGVTGTDLAEAKRGRMVAGASLFVLGFTAVFVSGGALFGNFGWTLQEHKETISKILGVITIVMGLAFMGVLGASDSGSSASTSSPRWGSRGRRCWAPCSASAGRRAWGRRSPPSTPWRSMRRVRGAVPCSPPRTAWGSGCRSWWSPWPTAGRWVPSAGSSGTTSG
ncbi:hypothetical protein SVIO_061700 [Streptomyces violaceusniger]|uniref:Cytochrome C biogenesis protein transmembrane domain-containing protein n=1 Tax=Streptomyces violaceusniger TaxID=68280 RepID=A0A4D4LAB3_STRVO|nr:hypothetical protein SVIO_061700 [Streptomyces violaceusniger]